MKPFARRGLPWLVVPWIGLGCGPEREPQPASSPATTVKTPADGEPLGRSSKPRTVAKDERTAATTKPETIAETVTVTRTTTVAPPVPTKAVPARNALFFREAEDGLHPVWALAEATAPDPTAVRDLGIVTVLGEGGDPVLARNGRWLAFRDDGRLEIMRIDGKARHRITKHRRNEVDLTIEGFSPDSRTLLFHQTGDPSMAGDEMPEGMAAGFQLLSLAKRELTPTPIEAFAELIAFTDDSRHVIFQRVTSARSFVLVRFDLDTGAAEELQRIDEPYLTSQLVVHGERIAYVHSPTRDRARVVADVLRGGDRIELGPEGELAQLGEPRLSLDGQRVSWLDRTTLVVRTFDDATTRTLATCSAPHCHHAWDSATTVLVLDRDQLSRVSLDGTTTPLADGVEGFTVAGAPGG